MNIINKINKKGNIFLNVSLGVFLYISVILFLPFITDDVTTSRAELGCNNFSLLTYGTMFQCILIGGVPPYFLWFGLVIAVGFLLGGLNS